MLLSTYYILLCINDLTHLKYVNIINYCRKLKWVRLYTYVFVIICMVHTTYGYLTYLFVVHYCCTFAIQHLLYYVIMFLKYLIMNKLSTTALPKYVLHKPFISFILIYAFL